MKPSILVLGTADWNQPIATNQHYLVRELAGTWDVSYVESLGLRKPELRSSDLKRMMRRLGAAPKSDTLRRNSTGVRVLRPLVIPVHSGPSRLLNSSLLRRLVRNWMTQPGPRVLWTYSPNTYGLEDFADATVYHCVDLLGSVPGIDSALIAREERRLAASDVTAIASSSVVNAHLAELGFRSRLLWPNVADTAPISEAVRLYGSGRKERAVFAGNLTASKVDFALLERLVANGVQLELAGPVSEGGGSSARAVERLTKAGAVYHGHLGFSALSRLYAESSVGLIPYLINDYTAGVNPLKTFEYLAAGLAVVSTPVPAVTAVAGHVKIALDAPAFTREVLHSTGLPAGRILAERAELADRHSWTGRGAEARVLVTELTAGRAS